MTDAQDATPELDHASSLESHPLTAARLARYRQIMEDGGFPYSFERDATASELHERFGDLEPGAESGEQATVAGRLMNTREMGKLAFGVLADVSGMIQLFVDKRVLGDEGFEAFIDLDSGDWIGASGEVITSKRGVLSVRIDSFTLLQ